MKKTLILGGTQFIGRNLVQRLLDIGGYDLTLFNRQQTQNNLFPDVKRIKGDRETADINQISAKHWDYVIDLSCYYPDALTNTLNSLQGKHVKYVFISTCSVYSNENEALRSKSEEAEILECDDTERIDRTTQSYGNRKAECERILHQSGMDYVILRPALVFGPHDHTDRFYYWLHQVHTNDTVLLPENGKRTFSMTYVNDLVDVMIQSLNLDRSPKVYNVITFPESSIEQIVECASLILEKRLNRIHASADFLKENNIEQWTDMPLWINGDHFTFSNERVIEDFMFKPTELFESVKETLEYHKTLGWHKPKYGITQETMQGLLQKASFGHI